MSDNPEEEVTHYKSGSASAKVTYYSSLGVVVNVFSKNLRQGDATRLLEIICEDADLRNATLVLHARPTSDHPQYPKGDVLAKFYSKFGFAPQNGRTTKMVRTPKL